jgi:hypothetical protein
MQAETITELEIYEPLAKAELIAQCERRGKALWAPVGTIIDDPDCWRLVMMGVAVPYDDECRDKTAQTPEQVAAAQHAARRLSAGIDPADFARYDSGELLGYDKNGEDLLASGAIAVDEEADDE